jgi:hypothetical protein
VIINWLWSLRQPLVRALIGIAQAVAGAYVGLRFFGLALSAGLAIAEPQQAGSESFLAELFMLANLGTIYFAWWIVPMGVLFGLFLKQRIRRWHRQTAWQQGAGLGAGLGLATAVLFVTPMLLGDGPSPPPWYIGPSLVFFPVYCAAWCALYSRFVTSR